MDFETSFFSNMLTLKKYFISIIYVIKAINVSSNCFLLLFPYTWKKNLWKELHLLYFTCVHCFSHLTYKKNLKINMLSKVKQQAIEIIRISTKASLLPSPMPGPSHSSSSTSLFSPMSLLEFIVAHDLSFTSRLWRESPILVSK